MKFIYNFCLVFLLLSSTTLLATNITFQVDMNTTPPSSDGVSVAYAPPTAASLADITIVALDDADGDGIYSGVSDVPHDEIGYFFVNGLFTNPMNFESVPEMCSEELMLIGLSARIRTLMVTEETVLPAVCFSSCEMCEIMVTDCSDPLLLISESASDYELETDLGETGPWQLWPGASIGMLVDTIEGENAFSIIGDPVAQDVVFATGDLTSGHYQLSWRQYVPEGNSAYFNLQHQLPTAAAGFWAIEVDFIGGQGALSIGNEAIQFPFDYPEGEFFDVILFIDLDNDEARLILGEYTVGAWIFSEGFTNGGGDFDLLQLSAINFYPLTDNYIYFVEGITLVEIPAADVGQYCYTATTIEPGTNTVSPLACFGGGIHHDDGDGLGAQWFQYTPAEDGWVSLSSCEGGSDSRGWILTGECHSLDIVGVNDDQCAVVPGSEDLYASYREATVVGGQTYYIMWDNVWDDTGFDFELTFNTTDLEPGDFCESAVDILPGTYDILEFTGNAAMTGPIIDNTSQGRSPTPYARTEWYQYTPIADGMMTISSCEGSASDNRVWVYTGECGTLSSLTQVASNDDGCETGFASLISDFPITAGTTYYIEWDNGWSDDSFSWDLIFSPIVAVDEQSFSQSVKLFPNPVDDQLQLDIQLQESLDYLNIRVINMMGSTLLEYSLKAASQYQETLDLSSLAAGTYIVQFTSGEMQLNRKVIVK